MPKFLIRIVALFLVPFLLVDPSVVLGLTSLSSNPTRLSSVTSIPFAVEALIEPTLGTHRDLINFLKPRAWLAAAALGLYAYTSHLASATSNVYSLASFYGSSEKAQLFLGITLAIFARLSIPQEYREITHKPNLIRIVKELHKVRNFHQRVPRAVTVFGSARFPDNNPVYKQAEELGRELFLAGTHPYDVMPPRTGAGPSIMEAVLKGYRAARNAAGVHQNYHNATQGIKIRFHYKFEQGVNAFVDDWRVFKHFVTRKLGLHRHTLGSIACVGGIGTFDEVFEVWQRGKPLALLEPAAGPYKGFWTNAVKRFEEMRKAAGLPVLPRPFITTSPKEAAAFIKKANRGTTWKTKGISYRTIVRELIQGSLTLDEWKTRAITFVGRPPVGSADWQKAGQLIQTLLAHGKTVRIASRGPLVEAVKKYVTDPKQLELLQAVLFVPPGENIRADETHLFKCLIITHDPSVHQKFVTDESQALVFAPGGVGTMNRLFDNIQLIQCKMLKKPSKIYLLGAASWRKFFDPTFQLLLAKNIVSQTDPKTLSGLISPGDEKIIHYDDEVDLATALTTPPGPPAAMGGGSGGPGQVEISGGFDTLNLDSRYERRVANAEVPRVLNRLRQNVDSEKNGTWGHSKNTSPTRLPLMFEERLDQTTFAGQTNDTPYYPVHRRSNGQKVIRKYGNAQQYPNLLFRLRDTYALRARLLYEVAQSLHYKGIDDVQLYVSPDRALESIESYFGEPLKNHVTAKEFGEALAVPPVPETLKQYAKLVDRWGDTFLDWDLFRAFALFKGDSEGLHQSRISMENGQIDLRSIDYGTAFGDESPWRVEYFKARAAFFRDYKFPLLKNMAQLDDSEIDRIVEAVYGLDAVTTILKHVPDHPSGVTIFDDDPQRAIADMAVVKETLANEIRRRRDEMRIFWTELNRQGYPPHDPGNPAAPKSETKPRDSARFQAPSDTDIADLRAPRGKDINSAAAQPDKDNPPKDLGAAALKDQKIITPDSGDIPPVEILGEKAYKLLRMARAGMNVPRFFVIATDGSGEIKFTPELESEFNQLKKPVIIRSAHPEEGATFSFSGILDSFKNVLELKGNTSKNSLEGAYQRMVRQATASQHTQEYLARHHITDFDPNQMNVVVMEQQPLDVFGMFMTSSQENPDLVKIEYEIRPKAWSAMPVTGIAIYDKKNRQLTETPSLAKNRILMSNLDRILTQFGETAREAEHLFGLQQVEVGAAGGAVYALQSRTLHIANPQTIPRYSHYESLSANLDARGYGNFYLPVLVVEELPHLGSHFIRDNELGYFLEKYDLDAFKRYKAEEVAKYRKFLLDFQAMHPDHILVIKNAIHVLNWDGPGDLYEFMNQLIAKAPVVILGERQNAIVHDAWKNVEEAGCTVRAQEGNMVLRNFTSLPDGPVDDASYQAAGIDEYSGTTTISKGKPVKIAYADKIETGEYLHVLSNLDGAFIWKDYSSKRLRPVSRPPWPEWNTKLTEELRKAILKNRKPPVEKSGPRTEAERQISAARATAPKKPVILVVDNKGVYRDRLDLTLEKSPFGQTHEIRVVTKGEAVLNLMDQLGPNSRIDALITDLRLTSKVGGNELALTALRRYPHLVVVIETTQPDKVDERLQHDPRVTIVAKAKEGLAIDRLQVLIQKFSLPDAKTIEGMEPGTSKMPILGAALMLMGSIYKTFPASNGVDPRLGGSMILMGAVIMAFTVIAWLSPSWLSTIFSIIRGITSRPRSYSELRSTQLSLLREAA